MAGIDLTNPQLQQHVFNAVRAAHQSNTQKAAEREKAKLREEERQRHQELITEMRRANDAAKTPTAPVAVAEKPYSQYAPDMDVSIGCVPCTTTHLQTIVRAMKAAEAGHPEEFAAARKEIVALRAYDLTPEKLAATPERERVELMKLESQLADLEAQMAGPAPEATFAAASLEESLRFARADGLGHPEAVMRVDDSEGAISSLERVTFAPAKLAKMDTDAAHKARAELPKIRVARQDLTNKVTNADELEEVTARIAVIDETLNPPPDAETIKRISQQAQEIKRQFRENVLESRAGKKG